MSVNDILTWLKDHKKRYQLKVQKIPFSDSKEWRFVNDKQKLIHKSGRFFAIKGYRAIELETNKPLIDQWEVGIQAFIIREKNENIEILLQAKTEPGNIGTTQLSPTLQVTRSNLQQVHKGSLPDFAENFLNLEDKTVLLNTKYPELGNRYFKKLNENIIIQQENIGHSERFRWVDIQSLKDLLKLNNVVNNDARLVASSLFLMVGDRFSQVQSDFQLKLLDSWYSWVGHSFKNLKEAKNWLFQKKKNIITTKEIPLTQLSNWEVTDNGIFPKDRESQYSIIQISVSSDEREVACWDQPIVNTFKQGLLGLICKEFNGVLHILFEASSQIGSHEVELLPSISFDGDPLTPIQKTLYDLVKSTSSVVPECCISEEGGRFFQDESLVKIIMITEDLNLTDNHCWLTIGQIRELNKDPFAFSDESRSALAILLAYM